MKENGSIESIRRYPSPNAKVNLFEILYWSQGLRVKGLLAKPKEEGTYDALLYLRGGLQSVGMVRASRIAQFASQGFIVFAPYYRGNRGGEGRDEVAGDDRYDAIHAAEVLKKFVDVKDIHLFGFSRGGLMALWTAILREDIKSVVTWAGVSSVTSMYMERVDMRRTLKRIIGGSPNTEQEKYDERTPLFQAHLVNAPVLLIHGTEDENVSINQSYDLEQKLISEKKQVETWYSSGLGHHYPPNVNRKTVKALCEWMKSQ
ncbi:MULTISPECIES: S9 family peptidase [Lysinibacillus]|uniref:S9 family peptidase n=1 Tax=Lysinibacillus antri TaxID=2498145 RepID=A0A3S0RXU7_9BACI|nr:MULTISPECIES: prolyl oligopeptidase family serine peptidase [Lysinibacillus]RUL56551.1 S9 family peptidase [Lysinibacillus antri]TSI03039.1 S9 family peptidase [Lysinibacillus sp. BW-2-10]